MKPLVDAAQQIIGGADIELPDVFRLPGRQRFRVHGFDVGIGEQAKHFQPLGRFHFFRELPDRFRIENIAPQSGAQFQVALDQKEHRFAVGRIQFEPLQASFGDFHAAGTWLSRLRALARVMQQQREIEQVGLLEFVEQFRIALVPFRLRLAQRVQIFDGDETCARPP